MRGGRPGHVHQAQRYRQCHVRTQRRRNVAAIAGDDGGDALRHLKSSCMPGTPRVRAEKSILDSRAHRSGGPCAAGVHATLRRAATRVERRPMGKGRLEAFSDGVIAIIITIMVLEMKVPQGDTWADLGGLAPVFLSYVLSFANVGIYWNNHHHMLHAVQRVNGAVLWANLHLLFWMSLMPFTTGWMGENHFSPLPVAAY